MATMNETFFEALLSPKAAKWSAGVAFDRSNPLPLDQWSVFQDLASATAYLTNAKAYPGQVIAYAEENGEMTVCVLSQNADGSALTLKPVGTIPVGDNKTIEVSAEGAVALLGAKDAANGTLPMIGDDGKLTWKTLADIGAGDGNDNTTYEFKFEGQKITITPKENGIATTPIELDLSSFITADELSEVVGKTAEGETAATGLYKAIADGIQEAKTYADTNDANTTYTMTYGDNEDGSKKVIRLVDNTNSVISEIDASIFIADGVLNDVSYDAENDKLIFVWNIIENTDEDGNIHYKTVEVDVKDLVDTYTAGNGLDLVEGAFSVKRDTSSESFLTVGANGVKVSGIQDAINAAQQAAIDDAAGKYATTGALDTVSQVANAAVTEESMSSYVADAIKDKADKSQIIDAYTKTETNTAIENAVKPANDKLADIESGAQVNKLESVIAASNAKISVSTIVDKTITIDDAALRQMITEADTKAGNAAGAASNAQATADANKLLIDGQATQLSALETSSTQHATDIQNLKAHDTEHTAQYNALVGTVQEHGTAIATLQTGKADVSLVESVSSKASANEQAIKTLNETTVPGINEEIAKKADANKVYTKTEIGTITEGKTIVQMIDDAKSEATYDDEEVRGLIANNATAITDITKEGGSIDAAVAAEAAIARAAEEANAKEITRVDNALKAAIENDGQGLDSIKELATWIEEHGTEASNMAKAIEENTSAIGAIYTPASGEGDEAVAASGVLVTEIARVESAYKNDDEATLTAAKSYTDGEIAKLHSVDNDTIKVNEENKSYVAKVSTDILEQGEITLVFCAGTASTVI